MDAVFLSRIQFGLSVGFHFIFPSLTLGLTLIISVFETLNYKSGSDRYRAVSSFLIRIFALIFTLGVATGIVLEFSFGTNWAEYSRLVGDIFGAPLAAEAIFAFFLESVFLGILLFGRKKVSAKAYLVSAYLVTFGSHLSAFWILAANSWMQTPAGFTLIEGRAVLQSFFEAVFNHSTLIRLVHVVLSSWIAGSAFVAGISAFYLIKNKFNEHAKPMLKIAIIIFIFSSIAILVSGHTHSIQVARTQPAKMASFEALWKTEKGAPMSLIGIPCEEEQKTYLEISVPRLLSLLIDFNPDSEVIGLEAFPEDEWPPIIPTYLSYHVMIGLGMLFIVMAFIYAFLLFDNKLYDNKKWLRVLVFAIPLPHIAIQLGWIAAEVGRQPWAVYGVLRTSDAASRVVPAGQILFTLIMFGIIYTLLFCMFIYILIKLINKGFESVDY
ncbi:MAG: cytochrome ubiquinol oxidase subunit I [Spirochaetes bacterium]|nr:cytochrome ubiquinol oxidase subunit I [Spirochaetota bacterium]